MDNYYLPGAEPFFIPGGRTGCIVIHGLASSPQEVRWLGEAIAAQGVTTYGLRLSGHGTDFRDLQHVHWHDWLGNVLDACRILSAQCDRIFLVGHSTGGTVALLAATHIAVAGVAALAAPVIFRGWTANNAHWLKHFLRYIDAPDTSDLPQRIKVEQRRRGEPELGRVRYDRWASNGPAQLYALTRVTRERLPLVKAPLLALYSTQDTVISFENCEILTEMVGSASIEKHTLHKSEHNIMLDGERETVFQHVNDFIYRHSQPGEM